MRRAVFLDRDGVINRQVIRNGKPYPPACIEEFEILPGVYEALPLLKRAGFLLICVTNQPDVARGKQNKKMVEAMNKEMLDALVLDKVLVCYHDNSDNCGCRKPLPGMLMDAADRFSIDLTKSFMVGDRWRDIEAGHNAGTTTIFIEYGYLEKKPQTPPDMVVHSLKEAAEWILKEKR